MMDPIVIDPPGFKQGEAWKECVEYVDKCGGLENDKGETNWKAAFGADPGCNTCPACHEYYWSWGRCQRCPACLFEYPTDWWARYSEGVGDGRRVNGTIVCPDPANNVRMVEWAGERSKRMCAHPYYRHGFQNPVEDAWKEHDAIDWKTVVGMVSVYPLSRAAEYE